jgi:hypothetical protein
MAMRNIAKLRILCPICGHQDWCMVSDDGKLTLCQRISNNHPNKKGGWWHSLESEISYNKEEFSQRSSHQKADENILDLIYKKMFELLPLSNIHRHHLLSRWLTAREITKHGYATLPINGRYQVAKKLLTFFNDDILSRTPGFYLKEGDFGAFYTIAGGTGFMIPVKNINQKYIGVQVRVDQPTKNTKYIWLSSDGKKSGTSSGNPCHVAYPEGIKNTDIWVTEGPLKANVIASRMGCISIAVPGIAHWNEVPSLIKALRNLWNIQGRNIIAYDADYKTKSWVKAHAEALGKAMKEQSLNPIFAIWDLKIGKGIDDVILSNNTSVIITKNAL